MEEATKIIEENAKRNAERNAYFNPITGEGSILEREKFELPDFALPIQYLPKAMMQVNLIKRLAKAGSIDKFLEELGAEVNDTERSKVSRQLIRLRCKHDFAFWAATFVYIKRKGGGDDVLFRLTFPQRKFVTTLENKRLANKPIRLVLLKARQWGGSTTSQLYIAWLQLMHKTGLNSLIIAHQHSGTDEIKDMFDRMIASYPIEMLYELGESYKNNEPKMTRVGNSGSIFRIPQRNCKIKLGTAEKPDSCRGGDYNLVHISEVGVWKKTDNKTPEDIVRSACSGILLQPYTMIVYESTANGTGNFFEREYKAAKNGQSQFDAMFVAWYDIPQYEQPIEDIEAFAEQLYKNRKNENVNSAREESGKYLWWLWEKGANLEGINWYIQERSKYNDHAQMASEYPSDDIEAFAHSGTRVFDRYQVEAMRATCCPPRHIGDVIAEEDSGKKAFSNLHFTSDSQGQLWVWQLPETFDDEVVTNRYLTVVDIGGRSDKADYSVISVFDRYWMIEGGKPSLVAQWYGHIDMDILAWKSVQIAKYYNDSLLVIESNTLETHDRERSVDGDQSHFILNQIRDVYDNLYARKQSEDEIRQGVPKKYGFHTNISTKPMIISTLVKVVRDNLYTERDERCLNEFLQYERKQNGAFGAIIGEHDDLLMTRAIGLHICFYEMDFPRIVKKAERRPHSKSTISAATI